MMLSLINAAIVGAALLSVIFFMAIYSSTLWEKTAEGRNLMLFPVSFILIGLSSLSRRADILPQIAEDTMSIAAWILVSILMIQRGFHVLRAQKQCKEWLKNQKEGE